MTRGEAMAHVAEAIANAGKLGVHDEDAPRLTIEEARAELADSRRKISEAAKHLTAKKESA